MLLEKFMNQIPTKTLSWQAITVLRLLSLILSVFIFTGCQTIDDRGFDVSSKINTRTKTLYDENGFDFFGRDKSGYNKEGYNVSGFNKEGYNRDGYNASGFDKTGFNKNGFDKDYNNKETGTKYNKQGYDINGVDSSGFDVDGFDIKGRNRKGEPKKVTVIFTSEYYIKDLKVEGFTVDWPTETREEFIVDRRYSITRPLPQSTPSEQPVETDLVVEYVNYAMNGFGHHRNESSKKRKVRVDYKRGTTRYFIPL